MNGHGAKDTATSLRLAVDAVGLPEKKYFKIGEVAALVGVEPHVLRYWQTQFPQVRPQKSRSGHRLYRRKDVETLLAIRELLHVQRFTIAGARQALRGLARSDRPSTPPQLAPGGLAKPATLRAPPPPDPTDVFDEEIDPADDPDEDAGELAEIEVAGLEDDELASALDRQLAEARGPAEEVEVSTLEQDAPPERLRATREAQAAPRPSALASAEAAKAVATPNLAGAPLESPLRSPPSAREPGGKRRGEQLGFGFVPSSRVLLEAARAELLGILDVLDREDGADARRRRAPLGREP